jgi:hypothetical protein
MVKISKKDSKYELLSYINNQSYGIYDTLEIAIYQGINRFYGVEYNGTTFNHINFKRNLKLIQLNKKINKINGKIKIA